MNIKFRIMINIPFFFLMITILALFFSNLYAEDIADKVIVNKSERKLYLLSEEKIIKDYNIALGLVPEGEKEKEGDFRTPEGDYFLQNRLVDSQYFLAIQISYPELKDLKRAKQLGAEPGGKIMIHGQPNDPKHSNVYYQSNDWTDGCIAVSNAAMVEIWQLTTNNTPITIYP